MKLRNVLCLLAGAALAASLISCGDDDDSDNGSPPTPTIGADETATPAAPTVGGPAEFLYVAGEGDTLGSIAAVFGTDAGELATLNGLTGEPAPGAALRVPLALPGGMAMLPETGIEAALGVGGPGGALVLLQPGLELRQGYLGKLALYSARIADGAPANEGYGYVMEYRLTDRAAFRAGVLDPEARFTGPAFTVSGGSLAGTLAGEPGADLYQFDRDGVAYAVLAAADAELSAKQIAEMLATAAER